MPLISDRVAAEINDKMADLWADILAAEQPDKWFYDAITETDDPDVEVIIGDDAEEVDDNLVAGLETYSIMRRVMVGFQAHIASLGGYTMAQYHAARKWRQQRFAADRMWSDSRLATLNRAYVCPESTALLRKIENTAATVDLGDIPATAGPARCQLEVDVNAGGPWVPNIYGVLETPATTLDGAITNAVLELELADATDFPVGAGWLVIGTEAMIYTGIVGTTVTLGSRGDYETAAAAHLSGATVYSGMTATPTITAAAAQYGLTDLCRGLVSDTSIAGQTTLESAGGTGADAQGILAGHTVLIKDMTSPQALTANCMNEVTVVVANADAFRAGDYVMLHSDAQDTAPPCRILSIDQFTSTITLTAASGFNFLVADEAVILLFYDRINMVGHYGTGVINVTVDDDTGFPVAGTLLIDDEELTYDGKPGANVLTVTGRGVNGTADAEHLDDAIVVLVQNGTHPGHNEVHTAAAVAVGAVTTDDNLLQSYWQAGFVMPLYREIISADDGDDNGAPADEFDVYAQPDRVIARSG